MTVAVPAARRLNDKLLTLAPDTLAPRVIELAGSPADQIGGFALVGSYFT
jgi:hypothetical protein